MATRITFDNPINSSVQLGDSMYYTQPSVFGITSQPKPCGTITQLTQNSVVVNSDITDLSAGAGYFLFAKNIAVNETSLKGYYADVKFRNNSNKKARLFSIGSEVVFSSK
jgi:hypothetical protein|tara:strand:- start:12299 stop:12628 length:330 start_codon:yes stop_codon:yes gene_type:complete